MDIGARLTEEAARRYVRAGYRLVGRNVAVEICRWTKNALRRGRMCYKRWYGVSSHRCIQMTPNLNFCNFKCVFCWRMHLEGRFELPRGWEWDKPREVLDGIIQAQRELLIGFKGNPEVPRERFLEAMFPRHVAISLDGEPALYPMLAELIREIKARGMTAFLVTNGSVPQRLEELVDKNAEPTNLYISVYGPTKDVFERSARPVAPSLWESVLESLDLIPRFHSRTVFRMTMVRGLNMVYPEKWAKLILRGQPKFVELKGYTWIGESQKRLPREAMPTLEEIGKFAQEIEELTGYKTILADDKSRVVMLVRDHEAWEENLRLIREWKELETRLDSAWRGKIDDFKLKRAANV